ncbi:MAG: RNA polymerase sigma factor [bacterium]|nr:RNA polymerase sigma factor [bacterium]
MQSTGPRLELLVLRAQANDEAAFAVLVERVDAALRRHARRYVVDPELVSDATQDAWLAIVRGLRRLEDPARFLPWALCIVARRAIDLVRRRQRTPATQLDGNEPSVEPPIGPGASNAAASTGDRLRAAVRRLDLDHRVVVELHYLEGLTLPEISGAVAVPVGTVKSRLHYARRRLREVLADRDGVDRTPVQDRESTNPERSKEHG